MPANCVLRGMQAMSFKNQKEYNRFGRSVQVFSERFLIIPCGSVKWVRSFHVPFRRVEEIRRNTQKHPIKDPYQYAEIPKQKHPKQKHPSILLRTYCLRFNSGNEKRTFNHPIAVFQRSHRHGRHAYNDRNCRVPSYF